MPHEIIYTEAADQSIQSFAQLEHQERIIKKIEDASEFPQHYLERLSEFPGYKLRAGDFRIIVDWDQNDQTIYIIEVFRRKEGYDKYLSQLREVWGTWRDFNE